MSPTAGGTAGERRDASRSSERVQKLASKEPRSWSWALSRVSGGPGGSSREIQGRASLCARPPLQNSACLAALTRVDVPLSGVASSSPHRGQREGTMARDVHCPYRSVYTVPSGLPRGRYETGQVTRHSSGSRQAPCVTHSVPGLSTAARCSQVEFQLCLQAGARQAEATPERAGPPTTALLATPVAALSAVA